MPRAAMPGNAVLDGHQLETPAEIWRIRPTEARTVERLATLRVRQWLLEIPPGLPEVHKVRDFALSWSNLQDDGVLRRLIASPRVYRLVLWRFEELTFRGDGQRTGWRLPNGWTPAVDSSPSTPTPGLDPIKFELQVRLGPAAPVLPLTTLDSAGYDGGEPPNGEVWRRSGSGDFKLGQAVAPGALLYVSVVPVYRVVIASEETEIQLTRPLIEPAELRLVEDPEPAP